MFKHTQSPKLNILCTLSLLCAGLLALSLMGCESEEQKRQRQQQERVEQITQKLIEIETLVFLNKPLPTDYPVTQICQDAKEIGYTSMHSIISTLCAKR